MEIKEGIDKINNFLENKGFEVKDAYIICVRLSREYEDRLFDDEDDDFGEDDDFSDDVLSSEDDEVTDDSDGNESEEKDEINIEKELKQVKAKKIELLAKKPKLSFKS